MADFRLKKGLDLPVAGAPEQHITNGEFPVSVGVLGNDYNGLKPKMFVSEGDVVQRGDPLFCSKDHPSIMFVSPCKGRVRGVMRGARRALLSVIIDIDDPQDPGVNLANEVDLSLDITATIDVLCRTGLWTSFISRPYSRIPAPDEKPNSIFVTALESDPLAPNADLIICEDLDAFDYGLRVISKLTDGAVHLCKAYGSNIGSFRHIDKVKSHTFQGPHPAGLAGTHMHFLCPPTITNPVWSIGYQDVLAIGKLFRDGNISSERVVSIAGPLAKDPRLIRTIAGASLSDITDGEIIGQNKYRLISGSILSGHIATDEVAFLGRYNRQITIIEEDTKQTPLGWIQPQPSKFSAMPVLLSALSRAFYGPNVDGSYNLTSNLNGGRRAMVPTGLFETLMPQDFLPTQLLRALLVKDTDMAQSLGALELDEEDLALCTFACPAKYEYGQALRESLQKIEKEG